MPEGPLRTKQEEAALLAAKVKKEMADMKKRWSNEAEKKGLKDEEIKEEIEAKERAFMNNPGLVNEVSFSYSYSSAERYCLWLLH